MKAFSLVVAAVLLAVSFCLPLTVQAAGNKAKGEVVMKMGNKVHLFHSGSVEASKEVAVGDILPVLRQTGKSGQAKQVGEVMVTGFIGDHYFEAEVVKGEIKVGDIAQKDKSGYLVQPSK